MKRVRLPIGDWTLSPYEVYKGCTEGAADKISEIMDICAKYSI